MAARFAHKEAMASQEEDTQEAQSRTPRTPPRTRVSVETKKFVEMMVSQLVLAVETVTHRERDLQALSTDYVKPPEIPYEQRLKKREEVEHDIATLEQVMDEKKHALVDLLVRTIVGPSPTRHDP